MQGCGRRLHLFQLGYRDDQLALPGLQGLFTVGRHLFPGGKLLLQACGPRFCVGQFCSHGGQLVLPGLQADPAARHLLFEFALLCPNAVEPCLQSCVGFT